MHESYSYPHETDHNAHRRTNPCDVKDVTKVARVLQWCDYIIIRLPVLVLILTSLLCFHTAPCASCPFPISICPPDLDKSPNISRCQRRRYLSNGGTGDNECSKYRHEGNPFLDWQKMAGRGVRHHSWLRSTEQRFCGTFLLWL